MRRPKGEKGSLNNREAREVLLETTETPAKKNAGRAKGEPDLHMKKKKRTSTGLMEKEALGGKW